MKEVQHVSRIHIRVYEDEDLNKPSELIIFTNELLRKDLYLRQVSVI